MRSYPFMTHGSTTSDFKQTFLTTIDNTYMIVSTICTQNIYYMPMVLTQFWAHIQTYHTKHNQSFHTKHTNYYPVLTNQLAVLLTDWIKANQNLTEWHVRIIWNFNIWADSSNANTPHRLSVTHISVEIETGEFPIHSDINRNSVYTDSHILILPGKLHIMPLIIIQETTDYSSFRVISPTKIS